MTCVLTQEISQQAFEWIRELFFRESGIRLADAKMALVASRLRRRLLHLALPDFDAYCLYLKGGQGVPERRILVDLLTTNETYFFREPHHFQHLQEEVLPTLKGNNVRLWCAAASSGEEPFSLAMTLDQQLGEQGWSLLATDLSLRMLERARRGVYGMDRLDKMPPKFLQQYCRRGTGDYEGMLRIAPQLRGRVQFAEHNLLHSAAGLGQFDVIFLRNVLIYFDMEAKLRIVQRVLEVLRPGGWLYVGSSESLHGMPLPITTIRPSIYHKRQSA